jgi:sec-independent protein translocase protein TatC
MSQLLLAIPLCILYEVGLLLAPIFARATQAPAADPEAEEKNET